MLTRDDLLSQQQAGAKASTITGGKLDVLIHNAAHMDMSVFWKDFDG